MRNILSSIGFVIFAAMPAQSQLLSFEEIVETVEGYWGIPYEADGDEKTQLRCDKSPLRINVWREENRIVYESQMVGHDFIDRSDVSSELTRSGKKAPFIVLRYEGEDRLTESGDVVEWRLFMTDPDTFYWQRTDWDRRMTTAPRIRCPDPVPVS